VLTYFYHSGQSRKKNWGKNGNRRYGSHYYNQNNYNNYYGNYGWPANQQPQFLSFKNQGLCSAPAYSDDTAELVIEQCDDSNLGRNDNLCAKILNGETK